jgi:GMP synthase PP-ATPase subunit
MWPGRARKRRGCIRAGSGVNEAVRGARAELHAVEPLFLDHIAIWTVSEVEGIDRVIYVLLSKSPGAIEWG